MQTVLAVIGIGLSLVVIGQWVYILMVTPVFTKKAYKSLDDLDCLTKRSYGDR